MTDEYEKRQCKNLCKNYNRNINFLRFLFSIMIIFFHMYHDNLFSVYGSSPEYKIFSTATSRSYVIVELFFILSGYYLYNVNFSEMTFKSFAYKKFLRLWPVFALATVIEHFSHFKIDTIMRLLFLQCSGLSLEYKGINWFVSSLFWTLLFYFSLIKIIDKKYLYFIIGLLVYFSYVFLVNSGFTREVKGMIFSTGIIRGIAGVGLGFLFHSLCNSVSPLLLARLKTKFIYFCFTTAECGILFFLIYCFSFHNIAYKNNLIFIIAFLPLLFSFIFKLGKISQLLENDFSYRLGTYSYALYVMQQSSFYTSVKLLRVMNIENFYIGSAISLIFAVVFGIVAHTTIKFIATAIKKHFSYAQ